MDDLTKEELAELRKKLAKWVRKPSCGCWLWTGAVRDSRNTYGVTRVKGKSTFAHRASYRAHVGPIPSGMFVCHVCDVKRCINPEHLYLGTPQQNIVDAWEKGLMCVNRGGAKLNEKQVQMLRKDVSGGMPHATAAKKYGIQKNSVWKACARYTWKNVK